MSLDLNEVAILIDHARRARSETHNLEFKDARGGFGKGVWKTISSFTNSPEGGYIVYGIEEKMTESLKLLAV